MSEARNAYSLDTSSSQSDIWLVKVPKFVANSWRKAPERAELGKLKQNPDGTFEFNSDSKVMETMSQGDTNGNHNLKPQSSKYSLKLQPITHQKMVILSQTKDSSAQMATATAATSSGTSSTSSSNDKISYKGEVSLRGELRASDNAYYMSLKSNSIREAAKPKMVTQVLDKAVTTYKPRGANQLAHEAELRRRKDEAKRTIREDKEIVLNRLYAAFEKQQYYNLKDLVRLTNQPPSYLKEILKEIGIYCSKSTHKNMWELKPEYRHYKS